MSEKNALGKALSHVMNKKKMPQPQEKAQGGTCYACGGVVDKMNEGGGVDEEYNAHSINDVDGDDDDLVYSPEVPEGSVDNTTEGASDDDGKKSGFLRAYMVSRRLRGK